MTVSRIGVSLEKDLLDALDEYVKVNNVPFKVVGICEESSGTRHRNAYIPVQPIKVHLKLTLQIVSQTRYRRYIGVFYSFWSTLSAKIADNGCTKAYPV